MNTLFDLFGHYNKMLATLATGLIVVLIAMSLAEGFWFFYENMGEIQLTPTSSVQNSSAAKKSQTSSLATLNLFGKSEVDVIVSRTDVPIATTSLNLELKGVFAAENAADSSAIVAQKGKTGELYHIGDRLPGNAILNAVLDDHILIKRGARLEKLPFSDNPSNQQFSSSAGSSRSTTGNSSVRRQADSRLQQVRDRIARRSQGITQRGNTAGASSDVRSRLSAYQQRLNSDPQAVLQELGVAAISETDSSGYRIGSEVSETMLRQAGLRKGDVIVSVNGQPVGNIANDKSLINKAIQSKRVRVEVQRGERRFYITVPVPQ